MIEQRQQARVDQLRAEWRDVTDAARELDHLADLCERERKFSAEANERAVSLLRSLQRVAVEKGDALRDELRRQEGWQSCR